MSERSDNERFVDVLYTKPFDAWTGHDKNRLINLAVQLQRELAAKQAVIDRLMFEHCPEEMTQEQLDEWASHQMPAPFDDQYINHENKEG